MPQINLIDFIRDVPDFPKPGILFKDITPLLKDPGALAQTVDIFVKEFSAKGITHIVGIESRGFIFGTALALKMGLGFIPVRKKGKLPYNIKQMTYDLEYGQDTLEIHEDAVGAGDKVLIVDDLLATGGTAKAVVDLIKSLGADVAAGAFVVELEFLKGREKMQDLDVFSIIRY